MRWGSARTTLGGAMTPHLTHALMLVAPLLVFAGLFAAEWRRTSGTRLPGSTRLAAAATAGAAVVHAAVVEQHVHEAALLGWAFTVLALAQGAWVLTVVLAPRRGVLLAGAAGNLAVVALWVWTRLVGLPLGVAGGHREHVGTPDLLATGLELVAVLAALYSATGGWPVPGEPVPWSKWDRSTTRNSPPPRNTSVPSGSRPSQLTKSLRPSRRSTFATRS